MPLLDNNSSVINALVRGVDFQTSLFRYHLFLLQPFLATEAPTSNKGVFNRAACDIAHYSSLYVLEGTHLRDSAERTREHKKHCRVRRSWKRIGWQPDDLPIGWQTDDLPILACPFACDTLASAADAFASCKVPKPKTIPVHEIGRGNFLTRRGLDQRTWSWRVGLSTNWTICYGIHIRMCMPV